MTPLQRLYLALADFVLVIHVAFVAFVVVGLLLVWLGWWCGWRFVRKPWFRLAHIAAIGVVAAESVLNFTCPLTIWEDRLRLLAGGEERYADSFIGHWLHQILFFDIDPHVFTIIYITFFLLVALSFWLVPPKRTAKP